MKSARVRIASVVIIWCSFGLSVSAQISASASLAPHIRDTGLGALPPQASNLLAGPLPEAAQPQGLAEPSKRMFGMIPDFGNTNDIPANHRPLTVREKFVLSLHQAFDISAHIGNAFQAAMQQAANSQPHYGEGWGAFGKRFAANEGDQVSGSVLIYGVLPSLLHEDPRYFRRGKGSTFSRMWYAASRTFVTRTDEGASRFNNSQTFGQLISCSISTTYYPQADRSVSRVFSNWGVNLAGNSGYNILSEYYPDMKRLFWPRHRKPVVIEGDELSP
ncbi:MAG: hypothetical protein WAM89_01380 [Terriglobales bacterium]